MEKAKLEAALVEELSLILDAQVEVASDLPGAFGLDSFGTMQVIVFLEDTFDIEVPEERFDIENFTSVQAIAQWAFPLVD